MVREGRDFEQGVNGRQERDEKNRKGLDELTRRPLGGRMLGHIEVDDFPSRVRQDDQHEENLEADRRHGKEVEGDELRQVVLEEGPSRG